MNDFEKKRNALFACLDDASIEIKGTSLEQDKLKTTAAIEEISNDDKKSVDTKMIYRHGGNKLVSHSSALKHLRGKESIFKKPELPIGRCLKPRKAPDYKINPHKWKKYSLEDVDISDQQNASAAFAFLRQIDEQKDSATACHGSSSADESKKIEFKKLSQIKRKLKAIESMELGDVEVDTAKLRGSKLVMPEYVVGQPRKDKSKKTKNKVQENIRAAGSLSLSHLQEDDDNVYN